MHLRASYKFGTRVRYTDYSYTGGDTKCHTYINPYSKTTNNAMPNIRG